MVLYFTAIRKKTISRGYGRCHSHAARPDGGPFMRLRSTRYPVYLNLKHFSKLDPVPTLPVKNLCSRFGTAVFLPVMQRTVEYRSVDLVTRGQKMKRRSGRSLTLVAIMIAIATILTLFVSPLILLLLSTLFKFDWSQLSNIGQSYTATATLLSAGALIAVAITVQLQAKQSQLVQRQTVRAMQFEFLRIALDKPELYGPIIGDTDKFESNDAFRQHLFTTWLFQYSHFGYQAGEIAEGSLREEFLSPLLGKEEGRRWYRIAFPSWVRMANENTDDAEFVSIVQDEYEKVVSRLSQQNKSSQSTTKREEPQEHPTNFPNHSQMIEDRERPPDCSQ
jgi:hypothetical protein